MIKILVTGASGMIGFHLLKSLSLFKDVSLVALDKNISLLDSKSYSLERVEKINELNPNIQWLEMDLTHKECIEKITNLKPNVIIHLAARAGISDSFKNPVEVINNNHLSFLNILEVARNMELPPTLLYASSSSVYGKTLEPTIETNKTLSPTSSYGLSKLMNEQTAQLYYQNYGIASIGLRFFTVYGEYNRKDMLMHYLLESFQQKKELKLYNNGLMQRDFTYVQDVVDSILKIIFSKKFNQHEIFNIGGTGSATLNEVVSIMQEHFNVLPNIIMEPFIPVYDPLKTFCNNQKLLSYYPDLKFTSLHTGINNLIGWYKEQL